MNKAITVLQKYAANEDGYNLYRKYDNDANLYFTKHGNADIGKLILKIPDSDRV